MKRTVYTVWYCAGGDIFKGYDNRMVSTHLSHLVADNVAFLNSGWVEDEIVDCHPDYIARMEKDDKILLENQCRIRDRAISI